MAEAGIDGGGLFKDFMEGLMRDGFGGDSGLFVTNSQRELYPAPSAAFSPVTRMLLRFLGAMLGKALWEGLLLELPLARFFLKSMLTADNLEEYIARVADFRLNVELQRAVEAFMQGFHDLIDPEWVVMFNEHEMQTLISGRVDSAGQGLDLEDMRAHTHYQ
ncbi:HECT domain-containing protein, partial [Haematococcus lacustris]